MTIVKRLLTAFSAFALCAAIALGSLSFMPKSFAISKDDTVTVPYISLPSNHSLLCFSSGDSLFWLIVPSVYSDWKSWSVSSSGSSYRALTFISHNSSGSNPDIVPYFYCYGSFSSFSDFSSALSSVYATGRSMIKTSIPTGSPSLLSYYCGSDSLPSSTFSNRFYLTMDKPALGSVSFFDYSPFFFPEMPHGYFDGNINVVDGTYNIDFPSNASISGAISQTGNDHYTWVWDSGSVYWYGDTVQGEHEGWLSPTYQGQTPPNGDITQTAYANRLINLSLSDLDSVVNYTPAYNENSRFRCWSCVMDSSYVWFVSDTRNKITGSIVSVTSDEVSWKYEFSDPQGGNTIYPTWAIVFSPMGEVIQVLSPTTVSNKNTYTLSCSIGTLEQDQDTGIWSCDPLYHGFWFSNDSPPVVNITHLNVAENKKYLANPVFGESAFQLQFLDSINRGIADINSNIQSLQSAMQSSISGQTSAFQNMDAPSAPQPSTSQMMDYFSKESAFSAPNTDEVFSGDIKSGHYWDGVTWWSTKFNDIIVSNQVIVAFSTAMLTLGLAVLIIGRRFSMR